MPSFVFTGLVETVYPETRDAAGIPVGAVEPGDVRDLDSAPDWQWLPAGPAGDGQGVEHPADGTWSPPVSNELQDGQQPGEQVTQTPEAAPAAVPAPPAVVPPAGTAFAVTAG